MRSNLFDLMDMLYEVSDGSRRETNRRDRNFKNSNNKAEVFDKREATVSFIPHFMPEKVIEGVNKKTGRMTTIVFWNDGTKTKVHNMDGDTPCRYMAFCAALAKRIYGSTDKAQKMVEKCFDPQIKKADKKRKGKPDNVTEDVSA